MIPVKGVILVILVILVIILGSLLLLLAAAAAAAAVDAAANKTQMFLDYCQHFFSSFVVSVDARHWKNYLYASSSSSFAAKTAMVDGNHYYWRME
mmetsp:Transcript_20347/g.38432  ORF Transcript_20347/g.38432 Transcript_20347/m.38432 type:complete len:95 (-) Transcript_20347:229-513(-)